jgi:chorismate mutase
MALTLKNPLSAFKQADAAATTSVPAPIDQPTIDIKRRRDQLHAKVAELQWDLGGLVYEMAVRDRIRVDLIIKHATELQDADAELQEIERILALEMNATAGVCGNCSAPHSSGAAFCWQCGQPILRQVDTWAIFNSQ